MKNLFTKNNNNKIERIPTGIPGLDPLIGGGLVIPSINLVAGTPGTGKTIFCAQIAYSNASKDKKVLYINLEQDSGRLENQMLQFNMNPKNVSKNLKIVAPDPSNPGVVEFILDEIQKTKYGVIVIDSLDSLVGSSITTDVLARLGMTKPGEIIQTAILGEPLIARIALKKLYQALAKTNAVVLLPTEKIEGETGISRDKISEFLVDGIIVLHAVEGEDAYRTLHIPKMRLTKQRRGIYSFEIDAKGIAVKAEEG